MQIIQILTLEIIIEHVENLSKQNLFVYTSKFVFAEFKSFSTGTF